MTELLSQLMNQRLDRPLREDEFRNPADKLVYCKRCGTPKQSWILFADEMKLCAVLCQCREERRDREAEQERIRRARDEVERNRSIGLPDPHHAQHTFEKDIGYNETAMTIAKEYCRRWPEMKKDGKGLLFWGDVGTGKTFIAGCIANDRLNSGVRVLMTNFSRLLNQLMDLQHGDRNGYINSLNANELLIIDDLGIERSSEFAREQVFNIVDSRYRSGLPLIVTTNLSLHEMSQPQDLMRRRIFDRVRERCVAVCVNERNIRKENIGRTMESGRELLVNGNG